MAKEILIKPWITEKTDRLADRHNQYTFIVHKKVNKFEIERAVKEKYGVTVESVSTLIMPAKAKVRNSKSGLLRGRKPAYKKAVVTLAEGEEIDFFGEI